jgi:hypothetical protein
MLESDHASSEALTWGLNAASTQGPASHRFRVSSMGSTAPAGEKSTSCPPLAECLEDSSVVLCDRSTVGDHDARASSARSIFGGGAVERCAWPRQRQEVVARSPFFFESEAVGPMRPIYGVLRTRRGTVGHWNLTVSPSEFCELATRRRVDRLSMWPSPPSRLVCRPGAGWALPRVASSPWPRNGMVAHVTRTDEESTVRIPFAATTCQRRQSGVGWHPRLDVQPRAWETEKKPIMMSDI